MSTPACVLLLNTSDWKFGIYNDNVVEILFQLRLKHVAFGPICR